MANYMQINRRIHYFIVPSLIGLLTFYVIPFIQIIYQVFTRFATKKFIGFDNLVMVVKNESFQLAIKNTALFMVLAIPLLIISALMFARLLNQFHDKWGHLKVIYMIPLVIPAVSLGFFWQILFSKYGMLNMITSLSIDWLNSSASLVVLVFIFIWKNLGYMTILFLAGIQNIPYVYIEAAQVDGADDKLIFSSIILPNLRKTCFVVVLFSLLNSFKIYRDIYAIFGDYPNRSVYMLQHVFNNWFRDFGIDKLSVGSLLYVISIIIIIYPINYLFNREGLV